MVITSGWVPNPRDYVSFHSGTWQNHYPDPPLQSWLDLSIVLKREGGILRCCSVMLGDGKPKLSSLNPTKFVAVAAGVPGRLSGSPLTGKTCPHLDCIGVKV